MENIVLVNDIVTLRTMELTDIDAIFEAGNYNEIWTHLAITIQSREDAANFVKESLLNQSLGKEHSFVIIDNKTNRIIGGTKLKNLDHTHMRIELGYSWLSPSYWRSPINTNCKYLLMQYCFEVLHLNRVQIQADERNVRSRNAIARIGATQEGIFRDHMIRKDGTPRNTVIFSVIRPEWPIVKMHMEQLMNRRIEQPVS
ncbi:GNAT family N-acetyltransferase [Sporosarcina pasteurii]|uniref:Ribosomal N-acetyltransferase YdaF n=1 Tax=Sporosarcina pasteurii TaxID=1474 RepID=A0A380BB82_SPOPA|nr:GNAT family protein [Sporosarcina pasteurii]MDS9472898.1 GNAT family protein [Sporosarcina pasteurii]QBQ06446.1 N-acetyltransferase [Sporosarcina pasteurii]SUI98475.1 Putative ribosomal N-acetyltransferase YdaF [Sporosarcina pasteurii]